MFKSELKEMVRLAYLAGIDDKNNDCEQWCDGGSGERAEELIQEFEDNGDKNIAERLEAQVKYKDDQITFLWKLLDDISTAGDLYKPEVNEYFKSVNMYCEQRSSVANTKDGLTLIIREYNE